MKRQKKKIQWHALALSASVAAALVACGGGSGGTSTSTPTKLSGVAATGAAFTGAVITVTDKTGAVVGTSSTIGTDGTFNITLSSNAVAPFVLTATRTNADGVAESLVSVVPTSSATATVNVSPVTTLIASRLSTSGDPAKLAAEVASGTSTVNSTTVAATVADVQTILAPVLTATNTSNVDPLTGSFTTNGTGYDQLLDSIKVTITPASSNTANIEIGVKQQLAEGTQPTTIQFTNQTTATSLQAVAPTIAANTLLASGTSTLIQQHLTQLNTCFALPTASRVSTANPSGATATNATEASVTATACRDAFIQSAGVIQFKSNGSTIGAKTTSAFRGLFYDGGTGTTFSQGTYEFTRANNDIVVSYKKTDATGAVSYDTFALRLENGVLKQIGNQYAYPGGVSAYQQLRHFVTLSQSAYDYYSTGYTLNVSHITGGTGVDGSIFDRVEVTSPRGNVLTLKPETGFSNLNLVKNGAVTGSNFVRLRSEYADAANTANPAVKESARLFFVGTMYTNAELAAIPAQSVWKFDYFLAGNTGATPDATQYYKTRARALTIPELQTKGLATLTPASIAAIQAGANAANVSFAGMKPISGETSIPLSWSVASGAMPPTSIQIWGSSTYNTVTSGFNDSVTVKSTDTSGSIQCTPTGASDHHCVGAAGTAYTTPTYFNGSHLWTRDTAGREYANFYAAYQLNP